jgi:hypothetical protein
MYIFIFIVMYFYYVICSFVRLSILIVMYVPFCVFCLIVLWYCLCVNVYCTTATGCQRNCS